MYRKIGFIEIDPNRLLIEACLNILGEPTFRDDLEAQVKAVVLSIDKDAKMRLNLCYFEMILGIQHPAFLQKPRLKRDFIILISHYLKMLGFIKTAPRVFDYTINPIMPLSEAVERILAARAPKWTADDLGGQFANLNLLSGVLPKVIRYYALLPNFRSSFLVNFRAWLQNVGWKLLHQQPLSQFEKSALLAYGDAAESTIGDPGPSSTARERQKYKPTENASPEATEAGALLQAVTLPGPMMNHVKMVSDTTFEELTAWWGVHVPEAAMYSGFYEVFGKFFRRYHLTKQEGVAWTLDDQHAGIMCRRGGILVARSTSPDVMVEPSCLMGFAKGIPTQSTDELPGIAPGKFSFLPDDPSIILTLLDQNDITNWEAKFFSHWRNRWITSSNQEGWLTLWLDDYARANKTAGSCQVEMATIDGTDIIELYANAQLKVRERDDSGVNPFEETYLLPGKSGPEEQQLDMSAFYNDLGKVDVLPAGYEQMELPSSWFMTANPRAVEFVATVAGLTEDQRLRFQTVISIYYNRNRYFRLTHKQPPIDVKNLSLAILGVK